MPRRDSQVADHVERVTRGRLTADDHHLRLLERIMDVANNDDTKYRDCVPLITEAKNYIERLKYALGQDRYEYLKKRDAEFFQDVRKDLIDKMNKELETQALLQKQNTEELEVQAALKRSLEEQSSKQNYGASSEQSSSGVKKLYCGNRNILREESTSGDTTPRAAEASTEAAPQTAPQMAPQTATKTPGYASTEAPSDAVSDAASGSNFSVHDTQEYYELFLLLEVHTDLLCVCSLGLVSLISILF